MDAAIVAEDLRTRYGETVALDGVSLSVASGEVFGLVGPNGAGKTTLVRALTGTVTPDEGDASLLGAAPRSVARDRVGLLPQEFRPHERLTARELVAYYRGLYDDGRDVEAVLADVGLADATDTRYEHLSGGQQRRVCVGTALVNDPVVLFLDEPTTGVDPAGRRAMWRLVEDLAEGGATVLLTTHDMGEAEHLADRVGLLADGSLVAQGAPGDLVAEHGGRPRLVVEVETGAEAALAGPGGEGTLATDDGVDEATATDDGLVFEGLDPVDVGEVARALAEAGVEYDALTWREPDLEDVYFALTGEAFAPGAGGERPGTDAGGVDG
jgi:ABC-2 type transport system ATP-binding protein